MSPNHITAIADDALDTALEITNSIDLFNLNDDDIVKG
jgi:flavin-binding protein dodecin